MNQQELDKITQTVSELDHIIGTLYDDLAGKELTDEALAAAVSTYFPKESLEYLTDECCKLRNGIQKGGDDFEGLMEKSEEELKEFLPDRLMQEFESMGEEEKHQYLMVLYQFLRQNAGHVVNEEEAIYIANISNEQLMHKVSCLMQKEQAEISYEAAEFLHEGLERIQTNSIHLDRGRYTEEENTLIISAAVYIMARQTSTENIPVEVIGEQIGFTKSWLSKYKESMLTQVIPTVMSILAVVGVVALLFLCFKLLLANSLFMTAFSFVKNAASHNKAFMAGVIVIIANLLGFVAESTFTGVAFLTSKFVRDEAQSVFEERFDKTDQMIGESAFPVENSSDTAQMPNVYMDPFTAQLIDTVPENGYLS